MEFLLFHSWNILAIREKYETIQQVYKLHALIGHKKDI